MSPEKKSFHDLNLLDLIQATSSQFPDIDSVERRDLDTPGPDALAIIILSKMPNAPSELCAAAKKEANRLRVLHKSWNQAIAPTLPLNPPT